MNPTAVFTPLPHPNYMFPTHFFNCFVEVFSFYINHSELFIQLRVKLFHESLPVMSINLPAQLLYDIFVFPVNAFDILIENLESEESLSDAISFVRKKYLRLKFFYVIPNAT